MTCAAVRNRILALEDPREVPAKFREHLDGCADCLQWWHAAVRVEGLLERLPVPQPTQGKKAAVIEQLTAGDLVFPSTPLPRTATATKLDFRRLMPFAGIAAAVAVVVGAWVLFRGPKPQTPMVEVTKHPLLDSVVQRNVALAKAGTPAERLTALGGLADDIRGEARDLARVASPEDMKALAGWYEKLVRDGLVSQAEKMPPLAMDPAAKASLLRDLAGRLADASKDSERLSKDAPPGAQEPLRRMAESARDGQLKLRRIAGEGV
jgi:hypothetical protein